MAFRATGFSRGFFTFIVIMADVACKSWMVRLLPVSAVAVLVVAVLEVARQGHWPVSSTCKEKLRNVRMSTIAPSTATLVRVGLVATVRMMSPATSSSSPSRMARPRASRKRL
jgi:predicted transcriptional regulator